MQMCVRLDSLNEGLGGGDIQASRACCKRWRLAGVGRSDASINSALVCLQEFRRPK